MTRLVIIFMCAVIGCMAEPTCNDNENLDNCPVDCASDYCPRSEEESKKTCPPAPNPCPPPACKCRINYRRVSRTNSTCIPTRDCPPFKCKGKYERYYGCPPYCPSDDCSQATPDGSCPKSFGHILILLICTPKCRCIENYWRQDGVCRPYSECPQNKPVGPHSVPVLPPSPPTPPSNPDDEPQANGSCTEYTSPEDSDACCSTATATATGNAEASATDEECEPNNQCSGPNEEYVLEKSSCPGEECYVITARINCTNAPPPQPGCACKSGYFRLDATSPCVHMCDCPQMAYALECQDHVTET